MIQTIQQMMPPEAVDLGIAWLGICGFVGAYFISYAISYLLAKFPLTSNAMKRIGFEIDE